MLVLCAQQQGLNLGVLPEYSTILCFVVELILRFSRALCILALQCIWLAANQLHWVQAVLSSSAGIL